MVEAAGATARPIVAMGMATGAGRALGEVNDRYLAALGRASDVVSSYGSVSQGRCGC